MIIIEYSNTQNAFHKTSLETMLDNNIKNIIKEVHPNYVPVAKAKTDDEADEIIKLLRKSFNKNQQSITK